MTTANLNQVKPIIHTTNAVRFGVGIVLSLVSAALLIFAFQSYSIWPLAFVAYIPMLVAEQRVLPPRWRVMSSSWSSSL